MRSIPLCIVASVALAACRHTATDPRTLPPLVAVTTLQSAGPGGDSFTGVVRARVESDLGFRVAGKVAQRLVDVGETVRRGQPLMRLDPTDLALGATTQQADVAANRARAVQAQADLRRLQGLVEQGAISAQAYDQAKAADDAARAQLGAAEAQSRVAANARGYAVLTADSDGVVEEISADAGQVVAAGQTVVRLAHAGAREASVALPETVRPALRSRAFAQLYGGQASRFATSLRQLSQSADSTTRTFEARYVLEGAGAAAPLGSTVTVTLAPTEAALPAGAAAEAPLGALYDPGSGPGVWRLVGDRVQFQPVKVMRLGTETAAVTGIEAGARIVALGADRLRPGEKVRPAGLVGDTARRSMP